MIVSIGLSMDHSRGKGVENILKKYILIIIFGIVGAMSRYGIGLIMNRSFPFGTMLVNLIGCFILPVIFIGLKETGIFSKEVISAMGTGFIGAFTTFSAFTVDIIKMLDQGKLTVALFYLFAGLAGGSFAAYAGVAISDYLIHRYKKRVVPLKGDKDDN